jgi:hypothetical protein
MSRFDLKGQLARAERRTAEKRLLEKTMMRVEVVVKCKEKEKESDRCATMEWVLSCRVMLCDEVMLGARMIDSEPRDTVNYPPLAGTTQSSLPYTTNCTAHYQVSYYIIS